MLVMYYEHQARKIFDMIEAMDKKQSSTGTDLSSAMLCGPELRLTFWSPCAQGSTLW